MLPANALVYQLLVKKDITFCIMISNPLQSKEIIKIVSEIEFLERPKPVELFFPELNVFLLLADFLIMTPKLKFRESNKKNIEYI